MKILEQGWLTAEPERSNVVEGVEIDPATRTRKEEYAFVVEALKDLPCGLVWDSATGYIPEWHRLAKVLANVGWTVFATDMEAGVLTLPPSDNVTYMIMDSRWTPFPSEMFDAVVCVSTLEHLITVDAFRVVAELHRCAKRGGRMVLTADLSPWLPCLFGGVVDQTPPPENGLNPQVYYVIVET